MTEVPVVVASHSYPVCIGLGLLANRDFLLARMRSKQLVIVTDSEVAQYYLQPLTKAIADSFEMVNIVIPAGEQSKTADNWLYIIQKMLEARVSRQATVLALGGGVVGDIAGFAAACYQRGIAFMQLPTTLLAMVDSAVGGKTAINHSLGKNMIGAFYQPNLVVSDLQTLTTLPAREYSAGLAEVLKYGLIWDEDFYHYLQHNKQNILKRDSEVLTEVIARCCRIKSEVVSQDERETGVRALLNFGHTFGHGIEAVTKYSRFRHGEAVAIGMCLALQLSISLGEIDGDILDEVQGWLLTFDLPVTMSADLSGEEVWQALKLDKKRHNQTIRFILLERIGRAAIRSDICEQSVKKILTAT